MNEETGVDLKIKISNDLLKWFLNESEAFYLLIDQNGKILSFSENVSDFFSLNNDLLAETEGVKTLLKEYE